MYAGYGLYYGEYYFLDFADQFPIDEEWNPLRDRQNAIRMLLSEIDSLIYSRRKLFENHKDELDWKIGELKFRFKSLQPGNQLRDPPEIIQFLEDKIIQLEEERRKRQVEFVKDIMHLEDRRREIILPWGAILNLGKNVMEKHGRGRGLLQEASSDMGKEN